MGERHQVISAELHARLLARLAHGCVAGTVVLRVSVRAIARVDPTTREDPHVPERMAGVLVEHQDLHALAIALAQNDDRRRGKRRRYDVGIARLFHDG